MVGDRLGIPQFESLEDWHATDVKSCTLSAMIEVKDLKKKMLQDLLKASKNYVNGQKVSLKHVSHKTEHFSSTRELTKCIALFENTPQEDNFWFHAMRKMLVEQLEPPAVESRRRLLKRLGA